MSFPTLTLATVFKPLAAAAAVAAVGIGGAAVVADESPVTVVAQGVAAMSAADEDEPGRPTIAETWAHFPRSEVRDSFQSWLDSGLKDPSALRLHGDLGSQWRAQQKVVDTYIGGQALRRTGPIRVTVPEDDPTAEEPPIMVTATVNATVIAGERSHIVEANIFLPNPEYAPTKWMVASLDVTWGKELLGLPNDPAFDALPGATAVVSPWWVGTDENFRVPQ